MDHGRRHETPRSEINDWLFTVQQAAWASAYLHHFFFPSSPTKVTQWAQIDTTHEWVCVTAPEHWGWGIHCFYLKKKKKGKQICSLGDGGRGDATSFLNGSSCKKNSEDSLRKRALSLGIPCRSTGGLRTLPTFHPRSGPGGVTFIKSQNLSGSSFPLSIKWY